jgi:hypothetical protein
MARATKRETDWLDAFRRDFREPTDEELKRFTEELERADKLRARLKIAPLTTGELVRSIRDQQETIR